MEYLACSIVTSFIGLSSIQSIQRHVLQFFIHTMNDGGIFRKAYLMNEESAFLTD